MVDFAPVAGQLRVLLNGTADNQLSAPTPCTEYTVGDLLDHLLALTYECRNAASPRRVADLFNTRFLPVRQAWSHEC
ncbi:Mycothiol maleylpyruvate isomerase N-terminal domain-containing protein [Amycolatopsis marina]|uniref:Mycothiol maleylpyruvate isomerase N-terminal domain-containing protein n=1 Tax=Amycolatopsis marina TaxID=490629 RepID=A0A1I0Y1Y4_9PSEU|nr:Mycothiol maleylpyruvate isomerase N-terminal domain-containing protein [Amycolatopsis marina]